MKSEERIAASPAEKDDSFLREAAKEFATAAIKKKYPVAPEPLIRSAIERIDRIDRKLPRLKRKGVKR